MHLEKLPEFPWDLTKYAIMGDDTLLSPTIMVLRRPRREEGGRGRGQDCLKDAVDRQVEAA